VQVFRDRQVRQDCRSAGSQRSVASNISTDRKADFQERISVKIWRLLLHFRDFRISVRNSNPDLSDAAEENRFYPDMRQVKLMRWQDIEI
jgi:hypothetical protein